MAIAIAIGPIQMKLCSAALMCLHRPLPSPTGNAQLNLRATAATATLATLSKPMWQTDLLTIIYSYVLYSEPWQLIRVIAHFETVYQTVLLQGFLCQAAH